MKRTVKSFLAIDTSKQIQSFSANGTWTLQEDGFLAITMFNPTGGSSTTHSISIDGVAIWSNSYTSRQLIIIPVKKGSTLSLSKGGDVLTAILFGVK